MKPNLFVSQLPDRQTLKKICKAQSVLDWIICGQEFETYHRFFKSNQEEYSGNEGQIGVNFEDEEGASLHIYFSEKGCLIVPSQCITTQTPDNKAFEKRIPKEFQAFYKKFYTNQDIPFVYYSLNDAPWVYEENFEIEETIHNLQHLLPNPEIYKNWADDFFGDETYFLPDANLNTIADIYNGKILSEEMVLSVVEQVDDWSDLERALNEIPYRFDF